MDADADEDNDQQREHNRRGRVHDDAERAVVGVGIQGMIVRHLRGSEQNEQNQADQGGGARGANACPAMSASLSHEFFQKRCERIRHFQDTVLDVSGIAEDSMGGIFRLMRGQRARWRFV